MSRDVEDLNRRLLRARDAMDRAYAEPLDVRAVAAVAHISEAHFIRTFRAVFGETPHRYLQRRRVERSMFLLREPSASSHRLPRSASPAGNVQRMLSGDRRRDALGLPRWGMADVGANCVQMRATGRAWRGAGSAIEAFWRRGRNGAS